LQGIEELILNGLSLTFIFTTIIIVFMSGNNAYKSYKKKKMVQTKLIAIFSFLIDIAMILLIGEKISLTSFLPTYNEFAALYIFSPLAALFSALATITIDAFALNMVNPKKYKTYTCIISIFAAIYVGLYIFDFPHKMIIGDEVSFTPWYEFGIPIAVTYYVVIGILIPLMILPVILFFYYGIKIRDKYPVRSKRALLLGIGGILLAVAYLSELIISDLFINTIMRSLFLISVIIFYYALYKIKEQT